MVVAAERVHTIVMYWLNRKEVNSHATIDLVCRYVSRAVSVCTSKKAKCHVALMVFWSVCMWPFPLTFTLQTSTSGTR